MTQRQLCYVHKFGENKQLYKIVKNITYQTHYNEVVDAVAWVPRDTVWIPPLQDTTNSQYGTTQKADM